MGVPRTYRKEDERSLANFPFTDLAQGTGIQLYYGIISENQTGETEHLISFVGDSVKNTFTGDNSPAVIDTAEFNLPRTIKGIGYVQGEYTAAGTASSLTFEFFKWDGSSETSISAQAETQDVTSATEEFFLPIDFTQTTIKNGEQIRLKVTFSFVNSAYNFKINPSEADPLKVFIPFRIDN